MTLTFCLGFANHNDFIFLFEKLWNKLQLKALKDTKLIALKPPFKLLESPEIDIGTAWRGKSHKIPFLESFGKVSGDIVCPYPPGIPLLIPGERIDRKRLNWIQNQVLDVFI